jgi:transposase
MGRQGIIYREFLEDFIKDLRYNRRKTCAEIAEIIQKEKEIEISSETVRKFISKENAARYD